MRIQHFKATRVLGENMKIHCEASFPDGRKEATAVNFYVKYLFRRIETRIEVLDDEGN